MPKEDYFSPKHNSSFVDDDGYFQKTARHFHKAPKIPFLQVSFDKLAQLATPATPTNTTHDVLTVWTTITKTSQFIQNGARLENISWRIVNRGLVCQERNQEITIHDFRTLNAINSTRNESYSKNHKAYELQPFMKDLNYDLTGPSKRRPQGGVVSGSSRSGERSVGRASRSVERCGETSGRPSAPKSQSAERTGPVTTGRGADAHPSTSLARHSSKTRVQSPSLFASVAQPARPSIFSLVSDPQPGKSKPSLEGRHSALERPGAFKRPSQVRVHHEGSRYQETTNEVSGSESDFSPDESDEDLSSDFELASSGSSTRSKQGPLPESLREARPRSSMRNPTPRRSALKKPVKDPRARPLVSVMTPPLVGDHTRSSLEATRHPLDVVRSPSVVRGFEPVVLGGGEFVSNSVLNRTTSVPKSVGASDLYGGKGVSGSRSGHAAEPPSASNPRSPPRGTRASATPHPPSNRDTLLNDLGMTGVGSESSVPRSKQGMFYLDASPSPPSDTCSPRPEAARRSLRKSFETRSGKLVETKEKPLAQASLAASKSVENTDSLFGFNRSASKTPAKSSSNVTLSTAGFVSDEDDEVYGAPDNDDDDSFSEDSEWSSFSEESDAVEGLDFSRSKSRNVSASKLAQKSLLTGMFDGIPRCKTTGSFQGKPPAAVSGSTAAVASGLDSTVHPSATSRIRPQRPHTLSYLSSSLKNQAHSPEEVSARVRPSVSTTNINAMASLSQRLSSSTDTLQGGSGTSTPHHSHKSSTLTQMIGQSALNLTHYFSSMRGAESRPPTAAGALLRTTVATHVFGAHQSQPRSSAGKPVADSGLSHTVVQGHSEPSRPEPPRQVSFFTEASSVSRPEAASASSARSSRDPGTSEEVQEQEPRGRSRSSRSHAEHASPRVIPPSFNGLSLSPQAVRRQMLATELSDSLRKSLLTDNKLGKMPVGINEVPAFGSSWEEDDADNYHAKGW